MAKPKSKAKAKGPAKKAAARAKKPSAKKLGAGATVTFVAKDGSTLAMMSLSGQAARLHESPAQIKKLMDLLDLPEGTDARVFTKASTVIVR